MSSASGGYYISAGTDRIVAAPQTITGSIGVIFEYLQYGGLADKLGVKFTVVKSGKLKDIGSPYRDLTLQERALLQQLITAYVRRLRQRRLEGPPPARVAGASTRRRTHLHRPAGHRQRARRRAGLS